MTIDLPDGNSVDVPDDAPPDVLGKVKAKIRLQYGEPQTGLERAGSYVAGRGKQFLTSLDRLTGLRGAQDPSVSQTASDVLTVAGPVVAPGLTAIGTGVGAAVRGFGGSQDTAELADAAAGLTSGVAGGVSGGLRTAAGLRGAISGRYKQVLGAIEQRGISLPSGSAPAQGLRQLAEEHLGPFGFTKKTAERQTAKALMKLLAPGTEDIPFGQLDEARIALSKVPQASRLRGAISSVQKSLVQGTPEGKEWLAVNKQFGASRGRPLIQSVARLAGQQHGGLLAGVSTAGELGAAGYEASQGRYKHAAGLVGAAVLGGLSPAQIMAAGRGAVGPAARGVMVAGASPSLQSLARSPDEGTVDEETAPDAPGVSPGMEPSPATPPVPGGTPGAPGGVAGRFGRVIGAVATLAGIPPELVSTVMQRESGGNHRMIGTSGEVGLMQLMPGTFEQLRPQIETILGRKAGITNPLDNLIAGALYLRQGLDARGGDVAEAGRYYNGGPASRSLAAHEYGQGIAQTLQRMTRR